MRKFLALLLLLTGAASATEAPMTRLTGFSASYEVSLNNLPFRATAHETLVPLDNGHWRLELRIESFLLDTTEFSVFRWDGDNCHAVPEHYGYARSGIGRDQNLNMRFDFNRKVLTRNDGEQISTIPITGRVEDKLGHTMAVACRVARGERGELGVDVAWDHDVRHFDYRVGGQEETVSTPAGNYRALRVERERGDSERVTTTWLAPATGWRAVQMRHSEGDGRLFQLRLTGLNNAR